MASKKNTTDVAGFNTQASQLVGRKANELEMWKKWKMSRSPADLAALMKSLEPLVAKEAQKYSGGGYGGALVGGATKAELRRRLMKAIETYDPSKGSLANHVINQMRSMTDVVHRRRNFVRMSKQDQQQFAAYSNAKEALKARGVLHPTQQELLAELEWPGTAGARRLKRLEEGIRKEMFLDTGTDDAFKRTPSQVSSAMSMMTFRNEQEKKVFKALKLDGRGLEVTNPISMHATALRLGMTYPTFMRIRAQLKQRAQKLLKGV